MHDWLMRQKWLWKLTGGRPMFRGKLLFTDAVNGNAVYCYTDRLGRTWMAQQGFHLFRVEKES